MVNPDFQEPLSFRLFRERFGMAVDGHRLACDLGPGVGAEEQHHLRNIGSIDKTAQGGLAPIGLARYLQYHVRLML